MIKNKAYTLEDLRARVTASKWSQELIDELEAEEQAAMVRETERINKKNEWYKNCIGKCFLVDFNGVSFSAYRINEDPGMTNKMEGVRFFAGTSSDRRITAEYNKKDPFNRFWLQNPYEDNGIYGNSGNRSVREITNEEFESYVKTYERLSEYINELIKS
jgi:hypothetical protein